ncbi:MAG: amino acid-binding protein [Planctomycetes bacterium]|nr:amino acid-binding protein [Planctomycetota bacterium]
MTVLDTVDIGTMRMVVDNVELAKCALEEAGAAYVCVPVIVVPIPNKKGAFARIARALAERNINIEYFYATAAPGADYTLGVLRVSDLKAALTIDFEV